MAKNKSKTAIVVGAGIGGLATAARLAHDGYSVTLLEKEALVGGRAHRIDQDGYRFDTGPTILMMTDVLYDTFRDCGKNFDDYIELRQLEPNYRVWFPDKTSIEVSSNLPRFAAELAKIDPKAPEQFYRFFADVAKIYRISRGQFIDKNFDRLTDFIDLKAGLTLLKGRGLYKLYNFVSRYFDDWRLRQLFSFQSMYLGVTPYQAPAVYSVVSYMETGLGIWYPKGGMHALPRAFEKLCQDLGVHIRLSTTVQSIAVQDKRTTGVILEDGSHLKADIVISNADLTYTYKNLIEPEHRPSFTNKKVDSLKQASSALLFYWGVNHDLPGMLHHNVYFSEDFHHNLEEIFTHKVLPKDPAFYLYIPTKTDPTLAPKNRHVLYCLVPVPNLSASIDWEKATQTIKARVLERMKTVLDLDLANHIETEAVFTPEDFLTKFNLTDGSAFGLSHYFFQSGYFRPHNVSRDIKGLYFVGASTYPGSGVPMVTLSGKLVAERINQDVKNGHI
ncbi:phytoene desaturase [Candidatus Saccharibacteria bacterium]|nr:phytoene desaturase [Candidatus Saccharibacteria bacterium]